MEEQQEPVVFQCNQCPKTTETVNAAVFHRKSHKECKFACPKEKVCPSIVFSTNADYCIHFEDKHISRSSKDHKKTTSLKYFQPKQMFDFCCGNTKDKGFKKGFHWLKVLVVTATSVLFWIHSQLGRSFVFVMDSRQSKVFGNAAMLIQGRLQTFFASRKFILFWAGAVLLELYCSWEWKNILKLKIACQFIETWSGNGYNNLLWHHFRHPNGCLVSLWHEDVLQLTGLSKKAKLKEVIFNRSWNPPLNVSRELDDGWEQLDPKPPDIFNPRGTIIWAAHLSGNFSIVSAVRKLNARELRASGLVVHIIANREAGAALSIKRYACRWLSWRALLPPYSPVGGFIDMPKVSAQKVTNSCYTGSGGFQRGSGKMVSEIRNNRRALNNINRNLVGAPSYPCAVNKRGLSEKQPICDKNQNISVHRPITRKHAAQMANKQQSLPLLSLQPEETKKPVESEAKPPSESRECTIVDVEMYIPSTDLNVPVYVKHTVAMLDDIDQMEEVEVKDIVEESVVDIYRSNSKNPLEKPSCVSLNYMEHQFDINDEKMKGVLVDWLIEVHYKFELMDEALFLTVNIIDRFLESQTVSRKKFQLVGVTAQLLACKYEEVSIPDVEDLILISDKAYTRMEVLDMEKLMVNTLQFYMSVPTPYMFMRRFLKAAQPDKKNILLKVLYKIITRCSHYFHLGCIEWMEWSDTLWKGSDIVIEVVTACLSETV